MVCTHASCVWEALQYLFLSTFLTLYGVHCHFWWPFACFPLCTAALLYQNSHLMIAFLWWRGWFHVKKWCQCIVFICSWMTPCCAVFQGDSIRTNIQLDFGDGTAVSYSNLSWTEEGIKHVYKSAGIFRVTALAENTLGYDTTTLFLHVTCKCCSFHTKSYQYIDVDVFYLCFVKKLYLLSPHFNCFNMAQMRQNLWYTHPSCIQLVNEHKTM